MIKIYIDNEITFHIYSKRGPPFGPRGPYKKKDKSANSNMEDSVCSIQKQPSSKRGPPFGPRGPYKKKNKSINSTMEDSVSKSTKPVGPRRAPNTMKALQRDYKGLYSGKKSKKPLEMCYTCDLELDRTDVIDKVVRCPVCNQVKIHTSCLDICQMCKDLDLI